MSMINEMLRDLDKRHAAGGEDRQLTAGVLLAAPARRGYRGLLLRFGLVALVAGVGTSAWIHYRKTGVLPPVVQVAAANTPSSAKPGPVQLAPAVPKDADAPAGAPQRAKPATAAMTAVKAFMGSAGAVLVQVKPEPKSPDGQPVSFKIVSPGQRSENFYRQAVSLLQQARVAEAKQVLRQAIGANAANHDARLLLGEMLVDANNNSEAATLLRHGLDLAPGNSGLSMALARVQVANATSEEALATLEQGLPNAGDDAEYHAFVAALMQNQGRHGEAVQHYLTALRSDPSMPTWLIGAGISLQAKNQMNDAAEAFQRALDTGELTAEVAQFASLQLKQMRQQRLP
jgi:MSHA biogenesis protein MshN